MMRRGLSVTVVAVAGLAMATLAGCSMGPRNLNLGFADNSAPTTQSLRNSQNLRGPSTTQPRTQRRQTAALQPQRVPNNSYAKAPRGALADRDYSRTVLDVQRARALINKYRRSKGLRALSVNAKLTQAAKRHSRDLAKWDRISHFGSDGSNPWDRVKRTGYRARLAAENVGTGQATIEEVFRGWQKSPGHNKNLLLPDARHMGIALVRDPKTEFKTFWTLVIGSSL